MSRRAKRANSEFLPINNLGANVVRTVTITGRKRKRKRLEIVTAVEAPATDTNQEHDLDESDFLNLDPLNQSSDPAFGGFPSSDGIDLWDDVPGFIQSVNAGLDTVETVEQEAEVTHHHIGDQGGAEKRGNALEEWLPFRPEYLEMIEEGDGFGSSTHSCMLCGCDDGGPTIRCVDCYGFLHRCESCTVSSHSSLPFHRLEVWNGHFWDTTSLLKLGHSISLGHQGLTCPRPKSTIEMTILHTNGFHKLNVAFCGCSHDGKGSNHVIQLLRLRLFPSTPKTPRTAFTFDVLDLMTQVSSHGRVSVENFYMALRHVTDNMDIHGWPKRYDEFSHAIRWYRHLLMLKRAGCHHRAKGEFEPGQRELALKCPACPQPGRNLPDNWAEAPESKEHLYATFLAMDANFRLKQKERGFNRDQYLGPGWAYFVDPVEFATELERVSANPPQTTSGQCDSTHSAIERANTRALEGYAVTGVGGIVCSRHGVIMPGIVDLQVGERQINMDMSFLVAVSTILQDILRQAPPYTRQSKRLIKLSYDIVCHWWIHLGKRAQEFPEALRRAFDLIKLEVGVPKYHLPAHGLVCQLLYSLNFLRGWCRTDGEGIERNWSSLNGFATATREMGPGARHDFLDFQMNEINFRKICGLGTSMLEKLKRAKKAIEIQQPMFDELSESAPDGKLKEWESLVESWQNDHSLQPNPYQETWDTSVGTLADLRKEMARQEAKEAMSAADVEHETTASAFLLQGIEIEEVQRSIVAQASQSTLSPTQLATLEERRTTLQRRILKWSAIQAVYMPFVPVARLSMAQVQPVSATTRNRSHSVAEEVSEDDSEDEGSEWLDDNLGDNPQSTNPEPLPGLTSEVETFPLLLPSGLDSTLRAKCRQSLITIEARIRLTTLESCISDLRRLLRVKSGVLANQKANIVGQKASTRSYKTVSSYNSKIEAVAARYRDVREKLLIIDKGDWQKRLKVLKKEDLFVVQSDKDPTGSKAGSSSTTRARRNLGEGSKEVPWIWRIRTAVPEAEEEDDDHADARTLWAKSHARITRWKEERELVLEEMRRIPWDLEWRAKQWEEWAAQGIEAPPRLGAGRKAYALKQSHAWRRLARRFMNLWRKPLGELDSILDWPTIPDTV